MLAPYIRKFYSKIKFSLIEILFIWFFNFKLVNYYWVVMLCNVGRGGFFVDLEPPQGVKRTFLVKKLYCQILLY